MQLSGIHHVTAVCADARENARFYTLVMGMRLVKRTVNQDDVSAYHLYYGDNVGSPGTALTFFDWNAPPETRGTRSVSQTGLRVAGTEALEWWQTHLCEQNVQAGEILERDGTFTLDFEDTQGQRLCLIDAGGQGDTPIPWPQSPVPTQFQVRGLGPVVLSVPELGRTNAILTTALEMREVRTYASPRNSKNTIHVYEMGAGGPHAEIHVAVEPDLAPARPGSGGVHHVAFRAPNREAHEAWAEKLFSIGVRHSGEIDRFYFRSLYFREPNGILFEIATDDPGFAVDEPVESLGEKVVLPPFLEPQRERILAGLRPID
ncbi:MAG TPA: ring-cleaving dioxygenase [Abditibacterium sp.]|jgi:glyoxalase family protein